MATHLLPLFCSAGFLELLVVVPAGVALAKAILLWDLQVAVRWHGMVRTHAQAHRTAQHHTSPHRAAGKEHRASALPVKAGPDCVEPRVRPDVLLGPCLHVPLVFFEDILEAHP